MQKLLRASISSVTKVPASRFHRFLGISYPSVADAQAAFENGLISLDKRDSIVGSLKSGKAPWDTELGGWVGIHGYPTDEYERKWVTLLYPKPDNWTDGCIAMWNFEIEEAIFESFLRDAGCYLALIRFLPHDSVCRKYRPVQP